MHPAGRSTAIDPAKGRALMLQDKAAGGIRRKAHSHVIGGQHPRLAFQSPAQSHALVFIVAAHTCPTASLTAVLRRPSAGGMARLSSCICSCRRQKLQSAGLIQCWPLAMRSWSRSSTRASRRLTASAHGRAMLPSACVEVCVHPHVTPALLTFFAARMSCALPPSRAQAVRSAVVHINQAQRHLVDAVMQPALDVRHGITGSCGCHAGSVETARAIYSHALAAFPGKKSIWRAAAHLEREHGSPAALDSLLRQATKSCPAVRAGDLPRLAMGVPDLQRAALAMIA